MHISRTRSILISPVFVAYCKSARWFWKWTKTMTTEERINTWFVLSPIWVSYNKGQGALCDVTMGHLHYTFFFCIMWDLWLKTLVQCLYCENDLPLRCITSSSPLPSSPQNTFWFGLGWCLVFFIPSIILSIKLAKFYRKMKYTDVYE